jgi:hypothetical protein
VVAIQSYTVTATLAGGTEIRDYPAHTLISVAVSGDFGSVGTIGFGPLVRYISGANSESRPLAMTSPVLQAPENTTHTISFVLPEGETRESAPLPNDSRVTVREVPQRLVAALRFSGGWSEDKALAKSTQLLSDVASGGYTPTGGVFYARYDPPWKPGLLRRNEALVDVS